MISIPFGGTLLSLAGRHRSVRALQPPLGPRQIRWPQASYPSPLHLSLPASILSYAARVASLIAPRSIARNITRIVALSPRIASIRSLDCAPSASCHLRRRYLSSSWLILASRREIPVSTPHSINCMALRSVVCTESLALDESRTSIFHQHAFRRTDP